MSSYFRRTFIAVTMLLALSGAIGSSSQAIACPNCKLANETESNRPRAYMYSILFMIGMPATIFTGFGLSFYRMVSKARQAELDALESESAE